MLQQTRAEQVLPYYRRFMKRFPSLRSLAKAQRRDVLKVWEGLGYYARARRLQDTARYLVGKKAGRFPRTHKELLALPGIGAYSAAAIGSLAMGLDVAVVDGNVCRVLARVLALEEDMRSTAGKRVVQDWVDRLLVRGRAGEFNEALMELGAVCCLPRAPHCAECPLRRTCRACAAGDPEAYPRNRKRKAVPHKVVGAAVIVHRDGRILLAQRKESSMLGGLWEFPGGTRERNESVPACIARELREELGVKVHVGPLLAKVPHAYSHFTMMLHAHWARIKGGRPRPIECDDFAWVPRERLREYPMPRADVVVLEALLESPCPFDVA